MDLVVDTRGDIVLPDIGKLPARGNTLRAVRDSIESRVKRITKASLIDLQIVKLSNPRIQIVGMVPNPGIFDVPAGIRLSSAIAYAGLDAGGLVRKFQSSDDHWSPVDELHPSLRQILVVNGKGDSSWLDLVIAIRNGDLSQDPTIISGDKITIIPRGPMVQLTGGNNFPGRMEIVPGESLNRFLAACGEDSSKSKSISIEDYSGALTISTMSEKVKLVRFPSRSTQETRQFAWVFGNVQNPGAYPISLGTNARDIIKLAGGIVGGDDQGVVVAIKRGWPWLTSARDRTTAEATLYPEIRAALLEYSTQLRGNYVDPFTPLQPMDTVIVHPVEKVVWIAGEVKNPGFVTWTPNTSAEEYIQRAGGYAERPWKSRIRVFDSQTGLTHKGKASVIRPGAAIIVPESRYVAPEQWMGVFVSIASLTLTATALYISVSGK